MKTNPGILSRVGRGVLVTLAGLLLFAVSAWTGAYFWLGSTPGRAQLLAVVTEGAPPGVAVEAVRWGPWPGRLAAGGITVRAEDGRELLRVRTASAELAIADLLAAAGGELALRAVEIDLAWATANIDEDGRVDLLVALAPPRRAPSPGGAAGPKRKPRIRVDALRVGVGELYVDAGATKAHLRDVGLRGRAVVGEAIDVEGELVTGAAHAAWGAGKRVLGWDRLAIAAGRVDDQAARFEVLAERGGERVAGARVEVALATGRVEVALDASLAAVDTETLAPGALPHGVDLQEVRVVIAERRLSGALGRAVAPSWRAGPFAADHLVLSAPAFEAEPGLLVPKLALTMSYLGAARMYGLDWNLEGVDLPGGGATLGRRLAVELGPGRVARWEVPTGDVGAAGLQVAADLGLTGGLIQVRADTDTGLLDAAGDLESSPLTKRTELVVALGFAEARGALLAALAHDLGAAELEGLGGGASGAAEVMIEVDRKERQGPWAAELTWDAGELVGRAGPRWTWDGYAWAEATPPAAQAPAEGEP